MAVRTVRRVFRKIFVILNGIVAVLYLIACLVPFLNPATWWFMGFFGLMFPYLTVLLVFFIFFWLVLKPKFFIVPLIILLAGFKQFNVFFAMNKLQTFTEKKDSSRIRLIDWNIRSLEGMSNRPDKKRADRATIPSSIIRQNADIVCLQEFNTSSKQDNIAPLAEKFKYHFFSSDFYRTIPAGYQAGSIIFSRYPIVNTGKVQFPGQQGESLIYADIQKGDKIFRVFTTHLQSFQFKKQDYENLEKIKDTDEPALPASKSIIQKMKLAFTKRGEQARIVRNASEQSPYPTLICGDFNDIPNSYTYFHIRDKWQDVFLETSLGIGRTYLALAPTLRIDYILPDQNFLIHQFDMVDEGLSDHLMLVSDLSLR